MFNRELFSLLRPAAAPATESLWDNSVVPDNVDNNAFSPVTVGTVFKSSVNGSVTHVRFYKGHNDTGTYTVGVWTMAGSLLQSANYNNATTGWVTVALPSAVSITAGTFYMVTCYADSGYTSYTDLYFYYSAYTVGHLTSPKWDDPGLTAAGNGCLHFGSGNTFPDYNTTGQSLFVDIVFTAT